MLSKGSMTMSNATINASEIARKVANTDLEDGQALYLINGEIVEGKDGCQPSNSCCLLVGPAIAGDAMVSEIQDAVEMYLADRI